MSKYGRAVQLAEAVKMQLADGKTVAIVSPTEASQRRMKESFKRLGIDPEHPRLRWEVPNAAGVIPVRNES